MSVLPWAGWAAFVTALAAFAREYWARRTDHEKVVVSGKLGEVEVEVKQDAADTARFDVAMKNYHELVELLRSEIDTREAQHQHDLEALRARLTALEHENEMCNVKVAALQRDVERIQAENYQLRQRLGG